MSNAFNPIAAQGNLNRVATHIVVTNYPQLNVNAGYMAKQQVAVSFDGNFTDQFPTATGIVVSQIPYVMGQIVISLLRSQLLANLWITQAQADTNLGTVTVYSDSPLTLEALTLTNASILEIAPGAFSGEDPTFNVTIKGTFYINDNLWLGITTV